MVRLLMERYSTVSVNRGEPVTFALGQVIKGWD